MKKRILAFLLAALLCAGLLSVSAFAADLAFTDVSADAWYYEDVMNAVETGLVNGKTETTFCPDDELTYAEAVKLAACMNQSYTDGEVTLANGDPWYQTYVDFAKEQEIISSDFDWNKAITRADYMAIFAHALPEEAFAAINEIPDGAIPDVAADAQNAAEIYTLYRAGVAQGDDDHSCRPADPIKRSEVAAILTRMMNADARISFTIAGETAKTVSASDFVGIWADETSQRAYLEIWPAEETGKYGIRIHWGNTAASYGEWNMTAAFSEETGRLTYQNGSKEYVTLSEDGSESREVQWTDAEGSFYIENGKLRWEDSRDESSPDFLAGKSSYYAPSADELVENYFKVIGGIETGTAGAALKQAAAARDVVKFADSRSIWAADNADLRKNILEGWEKLSEEEQAAFDANFISLLTLVNNAKADWDANADTFKDAGAEDIENLLKDAKAMLSWSDLTANTLTMGNSDGE